MKALNIFNQLPKGRSSDELFETLRSGDGFKIERIISTGQVTPEGQWYDQNSDEWVVLLQGNAKLEFENCTLTLGAGDYVWIPAHQKHRVSWTDPDQVCVWLAVHIENNEE
ncbi:MAG: cupin [Gammaproteobacteria bacterium CG11_big_fil_rev_8_21_14_0_20_46_22]|nr:MAG: cupin [Gammaproteobacteria bacterium CG12_big_fil_rev_8_21_14_0_65_46_12]PIR11207.1 MAG: cupin [Gammaproteobacteria bacterium CG11_big_fil_rev_8_21_14_0_20_46_22]